MDRIWQWAWDRYGARYSWAVWAIAYLVVQPMDILAALGRDVTPQERMREAAVRNK